MKHVYHTHITFSLTFSLILNMTGPYSVCLIQTQADNAHITYKSLSKIPPVQSICPITEPLYGKPDIYKLWQLRLQCMSCNEACYIRTNQQINIKRARTT